jgi:hypothetical protein
MNRFEIKRHGKRLTFKFDKCGKLFVSADDETLSLAMRVSNAYVRARAEM